MLFQFGFPVCNPIPFIEIDLFIVFDFKIDISKTYMKKSILLKKQLMSSLKLLKLLKNN